MENKTISWHSVLNHWKSDPDTYRYIQFDIILKGKSRTLLNAVFDETVCILDILVKNRQTPRFISFISHRK